MTMSFIKIASDHREVYAEKAADIHAILKNTLSLLWSLQDAETAKTSYQASGEEEHQVLYSNHLVEACDDMQSLMEMTIQFPEIQSVLADLILPKMKDLNVYQPEITVTPGDDVIPAESLQLEERSELIKNIRNDIEILETRIDLLLTENRQITDRTYNRYHGYANAGLIIIGLFVVFGIFLIKDYDEQQRSLITQMGKTNIKLAQVNKKEVALREEKNRFLGIAAHDLRHPLYGITSLAENLKKESEPYSAEHKQYIDYILESAEQMNSIISNLLDTHRIEEKYNQLKPERIDICKTLDSVLFKYEKKAGRKNLKIIREYDFPETEAVVDKSVFLQVADNLISNAIKFSPEGNKVFIRLVQRDSGFDLEVEDEGMGIPESERHHLFQKYQTFENSYADSEESSIGLGLSIVYELMKLAGGEVLYRESEKKGALFIAKFPDTGTRDKKRKDKGKDMDE